MAILLATSTDCELFDASPFPAILSRLADDVVIAVNRKALEIVRVSASDVVGRKVTDFYINPEQRSLLVERLRREGRADDILLQIGKSATPTRWLRASSSMVSVEGEPTVLSVFNDVTEQVHAEQSLRSSEQRLAEQSEALTTLTAQEASPAPCFEKRLAELLEAAARTLHVERVSIWLFGDGGAHLRCVDLYERTAGRHTSGAVLPREQSPVYFEAIETERVIAAADAHGDERTREFADGYLQPHGIGAMLDVPLRQRDTTRGVLCVEHIGAARDWTVDERNFALSVANLVSAAIAENEREQAVQRLAENEARVRLVLDTAHDAFVGMHADGKVVAWNLQAAATFGYSREEAIGQPLAELIIPAGLRDSAQTRARQVPGDRRRPDSEPPARAHGAAPGRPRVSHRNHSDQPDSIGRRDVFRCVPARHLGAAASRGRVAAGEGRRRVGDPGQERVPGEHEPRAPHPAERRARLRAAAAARPRPGAGAARGARCDRHLWRAPARSDQRHPRPVAHRSPPHRPRPRADRPARDGRRPRADVRQSAA